MSTTEDSTTTVYEIPMTLYVEAESPQQADLLAARFEKIRNDFLDEQGEPRADGNGFHWLHVGLTPASSQHEHLQRATLNALNDAMDIKEANGDDLSLSAEETSAIIALARAGGPSEYQVAELARSTDTPRDVCRVFLQAALDRHSEHEMIGWLEEAAKILRDEASGR
jgi:hypothetical protein